MKLKMIAGLFVAFLFVATVVYLFFLRGDTSTIVRHDDKDRPTALHFSQCVAEGGIVEESIPRRCTLKTGESFLEETEISASVEKHEDLSGNDQENKKTCVKSGCSGQMCLEASSENPMMSTCEYREEYGCYRDAKCEWQKDGECGWTLTETLSRCLDAVTKEPTSPKDLPIKVDLDEKKNKPHVSERGDIGIKKRIASWGFQKATARKIDTVIVHSSYNPGQGDEYDVDAIIDIYKKYEVNPHYIIGRKGSITQLVEEKDIAYHAGESALPDGRTNVNAVSIGIEIVGDEKNGFTDDQYNSINQLLGDLKKRYTIKYILGHSDIAPGRKTDPWNIHWNKIDK